MNARFEVIVGRIETLALDAVVNAANRQLMPGTGVDGALRFAAGPRLTALTATLPPIEEGGVALTPAFDAPMRAIIHTAAPVWFLPGDEAEKVLGLSACYRNSIALAHAQSFASIAFPCLGTGNFAWPRALACEIALDACRAAVVEAPRVKRVVFCCFTEVDAEIYRAALG